MSRYILTTEMVVHKKLVDAIISSTSDKHPKSAQLAVVASWAKSANTIHLTTSFTDIVSGQGLNVRMEEEGAINLPRMLRSFYLIAKGGDVVALAAPNVGISQEQKEFFAYVEFHKMQRVWASWATLDGENPCLFILTAPVIAYIIKDMPADMNMANPEWATWMHAWLKRYMLVHRYFNCDGMKLATPLPLPEVKIDPVIEPKKARHGNK